MKKLKRFIGLLALVTFGFALLFPIFFTKKQINFADISYNDDEVSLPDLNKNMGDYIANPKFYAMLENGSHISLTGQEGYQPEKGSNNFNISEVEAFAYNQQNEAINLQAKRAFFEEEKSKIELFEEAEINYYKNKEQKEDVAILASNYFLINLENEAISSPKKTFFDYQNLKIEANNFEAQNAGEVIIFEEEVIINYQP